MKNSPYQSIKSLLKENNISLSKLDFLTGENVIPGEYHFFNWYNLIPKFKSNLQLLAYLSSSFFSREVYKVKPEIYKYVNKEIYENYSDFDTTYYFHHIPLSKIPFPFTLTPQVISLINKNYKLIEYFVSQIEYNDLKDETKGIKNAEYTHLPICYLQSLNNILMAICHPECKSLPNSYFTIFPNRLEEFYSKYYILSPYEQFQLMYDINCQIRAFQFEFWVYDCIREIF